MSENLLQFGEAGSAIGAALKDAAETGRVVETVLAYRALDTVHAHAETGADDPAFRRYRDRGTSAQEGAAGVRVEGLAVGEEACAATRSPAALPRGRRRVGQGGCTSRTAAR